MKAAGQRTVSGNRRVGVNIRMYMGKRVRSSARFPYYRVYMYIIRVILQTLNLNDRMIKCPSTANSCGAHTHRRGLYNLTNASILKANEEMYLLYYSLYSNVKRITYVIITIFMRAIKYMGVNEAQC